MDKGWFDEASAELLGTFGVVFFSAGALVMDQHLGPESFGLLGIAGVHAVTYALAVAVTADVSGGHVNPAVTVAAFLTRRIEAARAGIYLIAQFGGGLLGALFVKSLLPAAAGQATDYGATLVASGVGPLTAVSLELVLTFFLVFTVFATGMSRYAPPIGGFAIGASVFVAAIVGGPLTGASLNPARSLGPALVAGEWAMHWVYYVGPILGGALAGATYDGVVRKGADAEAA